ncbi:MAG: host attachment protein [Candidatus Uhrbacteria bacterium]
MIIPEALQHFAEPSLIVVSDHFRAKLLLAFEDSLEEVEAVELPRAETSDAEGKAIGQEISDDARLSRFVRMVAEQINTLIRDEQAAMSLNLVAPADVVNAIKKELSPEAATAISKEIHADVMKEDEVTLLERIVAA